MECIRHVNITLNMHFPSTPILVEGGGEKGCPVYISLKDIKPSTVVKWLSKVL